MVSTSSKVGKESLLDDSIKYLNDAHFAVDMLIPSQFSP